MRPDKDSEGDRTLPTPKKKKKAETTWPEIDWPTLDFSDFPDASDFPPIEWSDEKGEENEPIQGP